MTARESRIGEQLGHYQLVRLLGTGGFAEVYLGEHVHLHTQVAVKLLHTQIADHDRENFKHEAQTIARLLHPHIVRVLDFGVEGNTPYLVIDYAPNGTLRHHHPRGTPLPLTTIVSYTKQVAEALQYAHDQRLIHRDVKPENMLLGRNQEVLLSDFGIALASQSSQYQSTQSIAGTIAYMAPEQIQAHPRPASDQYSLGIIVYEWLCGQRPFQGSYTEIAVKHSVAPPPPLRHLLPTLPSAVEQVVMIALNKDPHQRFVNVRAFAQALEQASQQSQYDQSTTFVRPPVIPQPRIAPMASLSGRSVTSTPPVTPIPATLGISSMPTTIPPQIPPSNVLPQNSLGTDVHSTSSLYPQATPPYFPPTPAPSYFPATDASTMAPPYARPQHSQRSISRRTFVIGAIGLAAASSAATWFVLSAKPFSSSSTNSNPFLSHLISGSSNTSSDPQISSALLTYSGHTDYVYSVAWSSDGKYIASGSQDGTAHVWNADNGQRQFSYRSNIQPAQSDDWANKVTWSPDNKMIAIAFDDGTVQVVEVSDDKVLYRYANSDGTIPGPGFAAVSWSPDGKYVAAGNMADKIYVYEVTSGKIVTTYADHTDFIAAVAWSHDGKHIASGAWDSLVKVWDPMSGQTLLNYKGHHDNLRDVAWSPDDTRIVSGGWDGTAQVWDSVSGHTLITYTKHVGGMVNAVAWSHHGRYIASGGNDMYTHVWEADTGNLVHTYASAQIYGVAWSPDDTRIVTAGYNKLAQVWDVN